MIGKEEEMEEQTAAERDSGAGEASASPPPGGNAPEETPPEDIREEPPAVEKMSPEELKAVLLRFGWQAQKEEPKPVHAPAEKHEDIREIFSGISEAVLNEIFSEDELRELEEDGTKVFFTEEVHEPDEVTGETGADDQASDTDSTAVISTPAQLREAGKGSPANETGGTAPQAAPAGSLRRRRYRTGCMGALLYFAFVLCISVMLAAAGWLAANDVLSLNKPELSAEITVREGESIDEIAGDLEQAGIIKYKRLFKLFAKISKVEEKNKIDPGTYTLSSSLDYRAIITGMQQGIDWASLEKESVRVLIPEGRTMAQTFAILEEAGVCSADQLTECATEHDFEYRFLSEDTLGDEKRLEGYLFPDTYDFYLDSAPETVIVKLLDNFNSRVTEEMYQQAERMGYSMHDIVTIASLIEKEAGADSERATIASVIYNRLNSNYYPYLEIDATVLYALGETKTDISREELNIDSPYNTYNHEGLPPGAIANPGLASIRAALAPEETGYYFYALGKNGTHEFFSTYSQFSSFINSSEFGG